MHSFARLFGLTLLLGCSANGGGEGSAASNGETGDGGSTASSGAGGEGAGRTTPLPPVDTSCHLPDAAFCDAFAKPSPGGRAGDLDDAKWAFARLGFGCSSDYTFAFPASPINVCGTWNTVEPGGPDSAFCVN